MPGRAAGGVGEAAPEDPNSITKTTSESRRLRRRAEVPPEAEGAASATTGPPELTLVRIVGPHLGRAAGKAGARARDRARALAAGLALRLGRRLRLVGGLFVGAEDLVLGLARQQLLELLGVDRLALEQDLRDLVETLAMLEQDVLRGLVRLLDDAPDLVVDLARDLVGVVGLGRELAAEERLRAVVAEDARAEPLRHAEPHHHLLRGLGHLLEVVRGAGGDLAEDDLLGGAPAEGHRHRVG